jgi:hypothetical protein
VQIDKEQIINLLRDQGDQDKAQKAEQELPDQVDTDRDAGVLQRLGIDPSDLISRLGGGNIPGL